MEKRELTITLKVLNEVKDHFLRTPRARVSQRKYISERGNFSFYKPRSKDLAHKRHFLFCTVRF